jgi:hypothetical protein
MITMIFTANNISMIYPHSCMGVRVFYITWTYAASVTRDFD